MADAGTVFLLLKPKLVQFIRRGDVCRDLLVLIHSLNTLPLFKLFLSAMGILGGALAGAHRSTLGVIAPLLAHILWVLRDKAVDLRHALAELFVSSQVVEHVLLMGED